MKKFVVLNVSYVLVFYDVKNRNKIWRTEYQFNNLLQYVIFHVIIDAIST